MADTRRQILLTIKEQARLLGDTLQPLGQHRWSPQQWWESFTFLFVNQSSAEHHQHQDDLLFFVRRQHPQQHPQQQQGGSQPLVFVRRKGKALPEDLQLTGRDFGNVDWAQTVLLNLVLHSQYQLTVVACGPEGLPFVAEGRTWSPGMISVTRPVYASTTVTAVNLDSSRAKDSTPQPCYPDICFAVDNFDNAFEDLALEDVSRCYCVVLHAMLGMADSAPDLQPDLTVVSAHLCRTQLDSNSTSTPGQQPPTQEQPHPHLAADDHHRQPGSSGNSRTGLPDADAPVAAPARHSSTDDSGSGAWQIGTHKRTLFAGYVSFQQILDFMDSSSSSRNGRSLLDSWLKAVPRGPRKDKVVMTGPGGMGRCEVAVTKTDAPAAAAAAAGTGASSNSSSVSGQQQGAPAAGQQGLSSAGGGERAGLLQRGLRQARVVASGVQQALDVLAEQQAAPGGSLMLCALMTLRLPVHYLAQELLAAV